MVADAQRGDRAVSVPALKTCPCCKKENIDLRKRSSYGIAYGGSLLCARCIQTQAHKF